MINRFGLAVGASVALVATTLLVVVGTGTAPAAAASLSGSPRGALQVWNLNTHKGDEGRYKNIAADAHTDWRYFFDYITHYRTGVVRYFPDVVTLQEVGSPKTKNDPAPRDCAAYVHSLEGLTGQHYACVRTHTQGGAAIVYRTERLALSKSHVVTEKIIKGGGDDAADCAPSTGKGWHAETAQFVDKADRSRHVDVAAVHFPLPPDGKQNHDNCAWDNARIVSDNLADGFAHGAGIKVLAGDWNHVDGELGAKSVQWECAYKGTNVQFKGHTSDCTKNLGWKDAMYQACGGGKATIPPNRAVFTCLVKNHASGKGGSHRIDFLFAKAHSISGQVTVPWRSAYDVAKSEGKTNGKIKNYSDHRGQGAVLTYG